MTDTAAELRQKTMQVRALRRLSECELGGLGVALATLEQLEHELVELLPGLRAGAEKEAAVRRARGLPVAGPAVRSWAGVRRALVVLSDAREEVSYAEAAGKVPKRVHGARLDT